MTAKFKWGAAIIGLVASALLGGCAATTAHSDSGDGLPDGMHVSRYYPEESGGRVCLIFTREIQPAFAVHCY
ncbi:hypothetical protein ACFYY5_29055 [Nocardia elegans]|uniref:Lipoprotein n=1 Tax=Nocardia elegans TaxID=300029 RepID=A0ABW6TPM8_9NOCA